MKKTDLEKNKALKLVHSMKQAAPRSVGKEVGTPKIDRREQRRLDQQQGLVPFACKLDAALVKQLQERASGHPGGMTAMLGELLTAALAGAKPNSAD